MKLKKLMLTRVLVCGLIFAGCGGDIGNSEKEEAVNSDVQEAWDDISGDSADEDESEDDTTSEDAEDEESDDKNEAVTDVSLPDEVDDSWYIDNGNAITEGIFTVGKDVKAGSYNITNPDEDDWLYIYVFETLDDYLGYYRTDPKSTAGEEYDALTANSYYETILYPGDECTVNMSDGNVLKVFGSIGTMINDEGVDDIFTAGECKELKPGVYSSAQIEQGTYAVMYPTEPEEMLSDIVLFENDELYKAFKTTKTVTVGDENSAIMKNGLYDVEVRDDKPCFLNLTDDSILYVDFRGCYIQKVTMNWSQK